MSTDKTSKEQKPKGRKKSRMSVKTNDCGSGSKEILQTAPLKQAGTVEQQITADDDMEQEEEFAVLCSQKIVPTFRKPKREKPAEKITCPDENGIPKKRLKTTGQCKNKSNSIVTTVQIHDQDKSSTPNPSTGGDPAGQSVREQSDQSNTGQTCSPADPLDVGGPVKIINSECHGQGVEDEAISDSPTAMQVKEQEQVKVPIEDPTKKDMSQVQAIRVNEPSQREVQANRVKNPSFHGVDNQELNTETDGSSETLNNSGKQSENVHEKLLETCHTIGEKTILEGIAQEQVELDIVPNKEPNHDGLLFNEPGSLGAGKTSDPDGILIDNLKCKGVPGCIPTSQMITANKLLHRDMDTNSHSSGQEVKIASEKEGQPLVLTNFTNNSVVYKTDQVDTCSIPSVPTLQVITAKAIASCDLATKDISTTAPNMDRGTVDAGKEADVISNFSLDRGTKTDITSNCNLALDKGTVDAEEISDSQLFAITAMDWTEEPLGPSGDTGRGHNSKTQVLLPSIPDGTAIVRGLIREVSHLNMMILRAKREMQTAKQRMPPTRTGDNRVNTRADK